MVQGPEQINIWDPDLLQPLPQRLVVRAVEGVLKVKVRYIQFTLVPRGVFEGPLQGLGLPSGAAHAPEALLCVCKKSVLFNYPIEAVRKDRAEYFVDRVLKTDRAIAGKCIAPSLRMTGDQVVSPHHKGAGPPPPQSEGGGLA